MTFQIEHYTGDITMESLPNENCIDKDGNYVLIEKDPSSSKIIGKALIKSWNDGCIRLLLDSADINSDIYGMTVEGFKTSVSPSDVYFFFDMGYPIVYDMYMFGFENAENEYEMPMRCYHSDSGKGSSVNIYAFTDNSKDFLDINQWELKRTFSVNNCESVSLAAGDLNNDGIDDLVIGESNVLDGKKAIPASVKVYSGGYLDMLTECTVIDSEFSKYGVTVFENNSSSKMRTYLAVLASDEKDGKITAYHFDGENYEETGSVAVTIDFNEKLNANEIYYANGYLMSPIIKSCVKFSANGLTSADYGSYNIGNALSNNDEFAFDFQTADLNGNGQQTVFYQTVSYNGYQSRIYTHSFGASEDIHFNDRNAGNLYALVNTDNDSFYMTYTGKHWFEYTEPRVLAVLASPPYFKDLLEQDDLSGNYAESTTAYGSSKGGGSGFARSDSFSSGAFVSYSEDIKIGGFITIASIEAEISSDVSVTDEFEESLEMSYSVEYATSSGADAVVFYSVPFEYYEYELNYCDNNSGDCITVTRTMCIPKKPCTSTIEMEKYRSIAENYSELPNLDSIMKHETGNPSSYPKNTQGYKNVRVFDGDYMAVDFTSAGGGITQSQTIEMSSENCYSSSINVGVESKSSAGTGGLKVGVTYGYDHEAGTVSTTTEGSSFTATMQNMPKEAEEYGYGMSWKLFSHEGSYVSSSGEKITFPVVDYLVTDVIRPPVLVSEFRQNYENSSADSIMLEWDYENTRDTEFFNVFRVSDINGRQAKVLVATVPSSAGLLNSDGLFTYTLEDEGQNANGGRTVMIPGMQYEYQIIAARDPSKPPCTSMPSEIIYAYTHTDNIYPDITLNGVTNNKLTIYPDREYNISAEINNEDDFIYIVCQWQKKGKTGWVDVIGETSDTLTIEEPDADAAGKYRCRVDALAYNEEMNSQVGVTVFTDDIDVTFKMRSVKQDAFDVKCESKKPEAVFTISSASSACRIAPTGTVSFKVKGSLFEKTYSVPLKTSGKQSTAKLSEAADLSDLADGVYQVTASYGGDSIYGSFRSETKKIIAGESAVYPVLLNENGESVDTLYYGNIISLKFYRYIRNADGTVSEEYYKHSDEMNNVSFKNQIGTYSIPFEIEGKQTVLNFTLKKRPVEIGLSGTEKLYAGEVEGKLPQVTAFTELAAGDKLEDLVVWAYISAENKMIIGDDLDKITDDMIINEINNETPSGGYYAIIIPKRSYQNSNNKSEHVPFRYTY